VNTTSATFSAYLVNATAIVTTYFYPRQKFYMVQIGPCKFVDSVNYIVALAVMDFDYEFVILGCLALTALLDVFQDVIVYAHVEVALHKFFFVF
jgi:hypothetical protein